LYPQTITETLVKTSRQIIICFCPNMNASHSQNIDIVTWMRDTTVDGFLACQLALTRYVTNKFKDVLVNADLTIDSN